MSANQSARLTSITINGKSFTPCLVSFQGSDNHLDQSGLISFTGQVVLGKAIDFDESLDDRKNITRFCRGNSVIISVGGRRHPRGALRILTPKYDSEKQQLTIEVGDLIALLNFREPTNPDETEIVTGEDKPIEDICKNLLKKAGIDNVSGDFPQGNINHPLNLSGSYLQSVGKLLYAHGCFGWIDKNETFQIEKINLSASGGVSVRVGRDEIWYRRLDASEQPCPTIKAVGVGKILRPYPKERSHYSESYGVASSVDPSLGNYRIITEQMERYETWDEKKKQLFVQTFTRKPIGLVVPNEVLEALFVDFDNKTALIESEYKEEYFYYEQDSECKLKRKQERYYRNIGNLYREVITGSSGLIGGYVNVVFKLGFELEILTDYEYNPKGVITKVTTTTNEHILSVLNGTGEDWNDWGNLDFLIQSGLKTEEWKQVKKGASPTWTSETTSKQCLVRVRADAAEAGPSGNKIALVDDNTSKYERSNSGQLTPPAPERCPVAWTIDEVNLSEIATFEDPCESDMKPRERTYSVEVYASAVIEDEGSENPASELLKSVASREGKLLFGRWKGQEIATTLKSGWFSYKPLMGIRAAELGGGVESFLVDGASWVIGTTKALVSCDGIWVGGLGGASVSVTPAIITTSTSEVLTFPGGTASSSDGVVTVITSDGEVLDFPGATVDSAGGETEITGGTLSFPYPEIARYPLGMGLGISCKSYPYLLEFLEAVAPCGLGLGMICTSGFAAPLGLGMGMDATGQVLALSWDDFDWDSADEGIWNALT